eukprot:2753102-Rhodomonas_salina.1
MVVCDVRYGGSTGLDDVRYAGTDPGARDHGYLTLLLPLYLRGAYPLRLLSYALFILTYAYFPTPTSVLALRIQSYALFCTLYFAHYAYLPARRGTNRWLWCYQMVLLLAYAPTRTWYNGSTDEYMGTTATTKITDGFCTVRRQCQSAQILMRKRPWFVENVYVTEITCEVLPGL